MSKEELLDFIEYECGNIERIFGDYEYSDEMYVSQHTMLIKNCVEELRK